MNVNEIPRIETHAHSHYSNIRLLDCINRPKDMLLYCATLGLKGVALTDHEVLSGHVEWLQLEKQLKENKKLPEDFKVICGNEIYLTDTRDKNQKYYHFILLAKDTLGHKALRELSSIAWYNSYYDRGMERVPTLKSELTEIVNKYKGHLIATTACLGGELSQNVLELVKAERNQNTDIIYEKKTNIINFLNYCKSLFNEDFYIEIAPAKSADQINFNSRIKSIAAALNLPMIFACDAHYLKKEDRFIHESYLNSKGGEREVASFYQYSHFMDNEEAYNNLKNTYTENEFEIMCNNSMKIYNQIGKYEIFHNPIIPQVQVKDYLIFNNYLEYPSINKLLNSNNIQERYWINQCIDKLNEMKPWTISKIDKNKYFERINIEADIIITVGEKLGNCLFEYFNTFQHFIDLFWDCGSLSGPGRGSSVCYLSNYLMGITQLDPLLYELPEWRLTKQSPSYSNITIKNFVNALSAVQILRIVNYRK